jgi:hypothetical protein
MDKIMRGGLLLFCFFFVNFNILAQDVDGANFSLDNISSGWTSAIMSGTIFDVFTKDLDSSNYNTDLKKKVFLQSDDAKIYFQRLEELKSTVRNQGIKSLIPTQNVSLSNYDLNNGGFWLYIGSNTGSGTISGSFKFAINGFLYEKLPVREETLDIFGPGRLRYKIFLPVKEDIALSIEGNMNVRVRLEMKINGVAERKFTFYDLNGRVFEVTRKHPVATTMKIILYDERSNDIFGEFTY